MFLGCIIFASHFCLHLYCLVNKGDRLRIYSETSLRKVHAVKLGRIISPYANIVGRNLPDHPFEICSYITLLSMFDVALEPRSFLETTWY